MTKYIEVNALKRKLRSGKAGYNLTKKELATVFYDINNTPSADVVEVKHGEWISSYRTWEFTFECSVCGKVAYEESNFCPNCGADMRGETE